MLGIKHLLVGPTLEEIAINFTNLSSKAKQKALLTASKEENLEIVKLLIELVVNKPASLSKALMPAAYHGQIAVIELLVANGADIHAKNEEALTYAATCHSNNKLIDGVNPKQGNLDVVKYLIGKGASMELALESHQARWNRIMDNNIIAFLNGLGYTF
jgi:ankyrin repeat protein